MPPLALSWAALGAFLRAAQKIQEDKFSFAEEALAAHVALLMPSLSSLRLTGRGETDGEWWVTVRSS